MKCTARVLWLYELCYYISSLILIVADLAAGAGMTGEYFPWDLNEGDSVIVELLASFAKNN